MWEDMRSEATVKVSAERAEGLRAAASDRWLRVPFEERILNEAVTIWERDSSAYEHADPRPAKMTEPVAEQNLGRYLAYLDHLAQEQEEDWSFVTPVAAPDSVVTKTSTVKVTLDRGMIAKLRTRRFGAEADLRRILHGQFPPHVLGDVEVVSLPAARKPVAAATEGKAKTVYVIKLVEDTWGLAPGVHNALNADYPSQAEARQKAVALLTEHPELPGLHIEAAVVREREGGQRSRALVTVTRPEPAEASVTLRVTTHTVKPNPTVGVYHVAFLYKH